MTSQKLPSVFGGAMIIAGTAIGAGMLAIPTATAGTWFGWSLLVFFYTWICMYASGLMVLEASVHYPHHANLSTIVKDLLGEKINWINSASLVFVLYILLYAYITSGGGLTAGYLSAIMGQQIPNRAGSLVLAFVFGLFVWISTRAVDKVATVIMIGMMVSFVISVFGLSGTITTTNLFDTLAPSNTSYLPYIWVAFATVLTSFGYQVAVPSLVKYFHGDVKRVSSSVLIGTLMSLVFYLLWQVVIQGNISRADFLPIVQADGDVGLLLETIGKTGLIGTMLSAFAYMALASSFLGVALGLFDFLSDALKIDDSRTGRSKTVAIVFVPPLIFSLIAPFGFVTAIGFAGLALTVWGVIIPALAAKASRKRYPMATYRTFGGQFMIYFVIAFGVINILAQIGVYLNKVPTFAG